MVGANGLIDGGRYRSSSDEIYVSSAVIPCNKLPNEVIGPKTKDE